MHHQAHHRSSANPNLGRLSRIPLSDPKLAGGRRGGSRTGSHRETDAKLAGLASPTSSRPARRTCGLLIDAELATLVLGEDPRETDRLFAAPKRDSARSALRGALRAYSAIDVALGREGEGRAASLSCSSARGPRPTFRLGHRQGRSRRAEVVGSPSRY